MVDDADLGEIASFLNTRHHDALLLISRFLLGHHDTAHAQMVAVSATDCSIAWSGADHQSDASIEHIDFERTAGSLDDVRSSIFALVRRARALAPALGAPTQLESIVDATEQLATHEAHVVARRQITASHVEITFGGLREFVSLGADEYVRLSIGDRSAFVTVRRWRPCTQQVDVWFVDAGGPVSRWATQAVPGQRVHLTDPRRTFQPPPDTTNIVAIGDATGLGAIARVIEELPESTPSAALVAVDAATWAITIPERSNGRTKGISSADVVGQLSNEVERCSLIGQRTYVFGAGESLEIYAVRRYLRNDLALDAERVAVSGYWRRS